VSERVFGPDREATPVAVEPVDAPGRPWKPRRGAPPARPGETRTEYSRRLKRERNRRHHARKLREAAARTPAAKIAAAAARPPSREHHPAVPTGFERTPRAETLSYQQWLEAVPMPEPPRSLLVTAMGQRSFDPLDPQEIEHCLRWLDGQPEVAGNPTDTIRAALASVLPGEPFSLLVEEPKPS
jgi:hypothetical protein